jgi:hypothetical protein
MFHLKVRDNLTCDDILEVHEMDNDLFLVIIRNTATDNEASIVLTREDIKKIRIE